MGRQRRCRAGSQPPVDSSRERGAGPRTAVVTAPVTSSVINDRLSAIGTGRANNSVTVKPYTAGRVTGLEVQSGQRVQAGTVDRHA